MLSKLRLRFGGKLFISHLLAVFLVSGSVGTFFYVRAMESLTRSLKSRLKNSAALLSQSLDARDLEEIRTERDVDRGSYRSTLEILRRMRRMNPDIAFLYIMRKDETGVRFVVDSDETSAQALPGREYGSVVPLMEQGFHSPAVDEELVQDEWGVFLSGYAPLLNGEGRYLVGIDMRADEVKSKLSEMRMTAAASLLASILLALLFGLYFSRGLGRRMALLSAQCREWAAGRYDRRIQTRTYDEFDDLAEAFNSAGESLQTMRQDLETTVRHLQSTRDQLEDRVAERTRELQGALDRVAVLRGLLPICGSCRKIRDDQGYWKQVEQFMGEQAGIRFTHGICPECAAKVYRELLGEDSAAGGPPPPAAS